MNTKFKDMKQEPSPEQNCFWGFCPAQFPQSLSPKEIIEVYFSYKLISSLAQASY